MITAQSLVPQDQKDKLAILADLNDLMALSLEPVSVAPPPSDDEVRAALRRCAERLRRPWPLRISPGPGAAAGPGSRGRSAVYPQLKRMLIDGLMPRLAALKAAMTAARSRSTPCRPRSRATGSPPTAPHGSPSSRAATTTTARTGEVRRRVAHRRAGRHRAGRADLRIGRAVSDAFRTATLTALLAVTLLLFAVLRRVRDVLYALAPLLAAGGTVILLMVAFGQALNFATSSRCRCCSASASPSIFISS